MLINAHTLNWLQEIITINKLMSKKDTNRSLIEEKTQRTNKSADIHLHY